MRRNEDSQLLVAVSVYDLQEDLQERDQFQFLYYVRVYTSLI